MSRLRPFQQTLAHGIFSAWNAGKRNVLAKSPTGSGKTVILAYVVKTVDRPAAVIAHRAELVTQISTALAREGVRHRVVGADSLRRHAVTLHMDKFRRSFVDPNARVGVCSVDTLVGKDAGKDPWFKQVGLWVQDEAHHVLKGNKWGDAAEMFPNAVGLGVTALMKRADGKGLGRDSDGLFDAAVRGPTMRELIDAGYLTDYRVFAPPSDVDYSDVTITASGDYSPAKLRAAVHASDSIVGDVVKSYKQICMQTLGRYGLGVTFAVDVENAQEIAKAFTANGIPAEIVSAKTPDLLRAQILRRFERREILQLVNVDLFGEGFDLPAIEVVSMVRKTESEQLYTQQFGRVLRLMLGDQSHLLDTWGEFTDQQRLAFIAASPKPFGIIIDHVGNVIRHGLPDAPRIDGLERRNSRASSTDDAIPLRRCANTQYLGKPNNPCNFVYERSKLCCPRCGFVPVVAQRSGPEFVDGDLFELDAKTLAALRGQVLDLMSVPYAVQGVPMGVINRNHMAKVDAQFRLRQSMALWAGWKRYQGVDDREQFKQFYLTYGVDVLTAQGLKREDAEALNTRITQHLERYGVVPA